MSKYHFLIPRSKHYDRNQTGFYTTKNSSFLNLRIQESPHELEGIVRLNKENPDEYVFEGYTGTKWVQFNAKKGQKGDTGDDFNKLFKFENVDNSSIEINQNSSNNLNNTNLIIDNTQGLIFKTLELDQDETDNHKTRIQVRSLKSGNYSLNSKDYNSINIKTIDNEIILNPNPQPFSWDFSNLNLNDLKTNLDQIKNIQSCLKYYGEKSTWKVKRNTQIFKGQAVRIDTKTEDDSLVIAPICYSSNVSLNLFNNPKPFLGIALEDSENKEKIQVCTYGITTVKCSTENNEISNEFMTNNNISEIGLSGLVSCNGNIFNSPIKPLNDFIRAGYFIETGFISKDNPYFLFFVEK